MPDAVVDGLAPDRPLAVDLDGTLLRTDLLLESLLALVVASPWQALAALWTLRHGKAAFKRRIAELTPLDPGSLPLNTVLLDWLRREKARGRRLVLATAAEEAQARAIAAPLALFDTVLASDGRTNLRGAAKASRLIATFGRHGFDYAGNAPCDAAVWAQAGDAVVVNADRATIRGARGQHPGALILDPRLGWRSGEMLRALRPHQWLKNLLVFVPGLTAQHFDMATLAHDALAFGSFSLCASGAYVINDLADLGHDRAHPTKHARPFAIGHLSILDGLVAIPALLGLSALLAMLLPAPFLGMLGLYFTLTLAYSGALKRRAVVDVITLACLYGMRLMAGAAAVSVDVSRWLLGFAVFLFLGLALIKRCAELTVRAARALGDPPGRAYRLSDLPLLQMLAAASCYAAVLVFCLYINGETVAALYGHPQRLWAIPLVLLYWLSRVMLLTHRGEMHEDPVLFAATDRTSRACAVAIVLVAAASV